MTRHCAILALILCAWGSVYHWAAWPLMAGLLWLIVGRDPLWLAAAALTWLRSQAIRAAIAAGVGARAWGKAGRMSAYLAKEDAWREAN